MYKRYFRKKEPDCKKGESEWIEMNGKDFYRFIKMPENKNRNFIDMGDVVLEVTDFAAREHRAEKDHSDYLKEQEVDWRTQSIYALETEDGCCGEEVIADDTQDVETQVILSLEVEALRTALSLLDSQSYLIIHALYLAEDRKTERELAAEYGLSQNAINKRKKEILKKLKSLVVKIQKSSQ